MCGGMVPHCLRVFPDPMVSTFDIPAPSGASSPNAFFRWVDCSDKKRPHELQRPDDSRLRVAHLTDPHVPSDVDLFSRLVELVRPHGSVGSVSKEVSAFSNELGHAYQSNPERYTNLLKKALFGLHELDVEHLVVTGDLAHCGLSREFVEMRAVLEVTGWWGEDRLTVVPGNHDRFNLYEDIERSSVDDFYPVVTPKQPRLKELGEGVALLEIDSNRHPEDPHVLEQWLPTTAGLVYQDVVDWVAEQHGDVEAARLVTLIHHHVTNDWYPAAPVDLGGLMDPVDGFEMLMREVEKIDPSGPVLHGHVHDVMPVEYCWESHRLSCPGGFHQEHTLNVIDFGPDLEETITQIEIRR